MHPRYPFNFAAGHFMDFEVQLQMHVYGRSMEQFGKWEQHKDALSSPEDVARWQEHIRRCALEALGGLPEGGAPLNPRITGELKQERFKVEKVIFESRPGVHVTSSLYIPEDFAGPTPAVLFVCGHAMEAKASPVYQAVCRRLARNGLVVLAIDPPGQGERKSYLDEDGNEIIGWGTTEHSYAGLQCWLNGQSPARYFVHDAMRAIDYLQSRPEVDPERIGVTGNSGGGTQSTWLMMVEPRLAAAAPGTFVMRRLEYMWTGQAQDLEQIIPSGTLNGLDHEDFLIAMAPRPVLVLAAEYDYFCIEGTRASVERARRIYGILGKEDNLGLATGRHTHSYSPVLAKASTEFFCRHFLSKSPSEVDHAEPEPLFPDKLNCTESGQIMLDIPDTRRIFDRNLEEYQNNKSLDAQEAAEWLKNNVRRHRTECDLNPRWPWDTVVDGLRISHGFWFSEPGMCNAGFLVRQEDGDFDGLTIALFHDGTLELEQRKQWVFDKARSGQAVLVTDVRGMGNLLPRAVSPRDRQQHYGTIFKLNCDLVCLGDDLASMRVYDVLRAVELAQSDPMMELGDRPVSIFGSGHSGVYAYLAGAIEPGLASVGIEDAPFSFGSMVCTRLYHDERLDQVVMYGMAAEFDLPDLLPLFEERELVILGPRDAEGRIMEEYERA